MAGINGFPFALQLALIELIPTSAELIALNDPGAFAYVAVDAIVILLLYEGDGLLFCDRATIVYVVFACRLLRIKIVIAPDDVVLTS